jgi:t-SNARE complex subunit (syntaxin)
VLLRWQDKEREMDDLVDDIGKNLDLLGAKLDAQGELIENQNQVIDQAEKEAIKTNAKFESTNKRLKDLVDKYRAPSKLCMDCCLIFLVIVLIGILVKQFSG